MIGRFGLEVRLCVGFPPEQLRISSPSPLGSKNRSISPRAHRDRVSKNVASERTSAYFEFAEAILCGGCDLVCIVIATRGNAVNFGWACNE